MLIMGKRDISKTELSKWCESEYLNYKHTYVERSGMFSPAKYKAALLALFSKKIYSLEDTAKKVGATYGTLRVWRSEENFKRQVIENIERFTQFYISLSHELTTKGETVSYHPSIEFAPPSLRKIQLAQEVAYYSHDLIRSIILSLKDEAAKEFEEIENESLPSSESRALLSFIMKTAEETLRGMNDLKTLHIVNLLRIEGLSGLQGNQLDYIDHCLEKGISIHPTFVKSMLEVNKDITNRLERALKEAESI